MVTSLIYNLRGYIGQGEVYNNTGNSYIIGIVKSTKELAMHQR